MSDAIKTEGHRFSLFSNVGESCFFNAELKIHHQQFLMLINFIMQF